MRLLVISNMHPSKEKPYSGLFVVNQVEEIKRNISMLDFFYMERKFTGLLGSFSKYFQFLFRFFFFCLKKTKKNSIYDIVHVHYYFPTIYLGIIYKLIFNRNVKLVVTFHGSDVYKSEGNVIYKFPMRFVDHVISVSQGLAERIERIYTKDISIIPAGIRKCFDPPIEKRFYKDKKYDYIFIGSFYEVKGFDRLIDLIESDSENKRFCVVGSGPLVSNLKPCKNVDVFENLSQEDIVPLIWASRYCLNLSRNESFGLSMAESMACGTPVIATLTDGSKQQINNGINGYLISEQRDTANIIHQINQVYNSISSHDYEKLSQAAVKTSQAFKLPSVAKEVINVYHKLMK